VPSSFFGVAISIPIVMLGKERLRLCQPPFELA